MQSMLHACRQIRVIQASWQFEEEWGLLSKDHPAKLFRPLPVFADCLDRKMLSLRDPPIVLPRFIIFYNSDFE